MEVDGNAKESVHDESYLQKDFVVDKKCNPSVLSAANEYMKFLKKSEGDCSLTYDNIILKKESEQKDDFLQQIEEVCSKEYSNIKNTEDITKSSEQEFLKKIEEMEEIGLGKEKDINFEKKVKVSEDLKAKKKFECEATSVDAVACDKVIDVKKEIAMNVNSNKTSVFKETTYLDPETIPKYEMPRQDATALSLTKTRNSLAVVQVPEEKYEFGKIDKYEQISVSLLTTVNKVSECDVNKKKEPTDTKRIDSFATLFDKMEEVDTVGLLNEEGMTVKANEPLSIENLENLNAKLKVEFISETCKNAVTNDVAEESVILTDKANEEKSFDFEPLLELEHLKMDKIDPVGVESHANYGNENKDLLTETKPETQLDLKTKANSFCSSLVNTVVSSNKNFENLTESGTCGTTETENPSSNGRMNKYIDTIKRHSCVPDTTIEKEDSIKPDKIETAELFEIKISNFSDTDLKNDSVYEVSVCCERNDVRYLSIERIDSFTTKSKSQTDNALTSEISIQSSSYGSLTSVQADPLPQAVNTSTSTNSVIASRDKHTFLGIDELCNFMINQFTKIKHAINLESAKEIDVTLTGSSTPVQQLKKIKKNTPSAEASTSKAKHAHKRSLQEGDVESNLKAKQFKLYSKETFKADETIDSENVKAGLCVLAKWVDKKFYAGKITDEKPGNKFVVLFEDGASKTLTKESIVFGEDNILPLQDKQVYALVEEDYESGIVVSIDKFSNKVFYNIKTENGLVKVTASDIYLEVDQAKDIQKMQNLKIRDGLEEEGSIGTRPSRNKRPPASPSTPQAGYSGAAVGKRGGKRQQRYS